MKIIFKDELEKEELIKILNRSPNCPSNFGLEEMCVPFATEYECEKCWDNALKEVEEVTSNAKRKRVKRVFRRTRGR